MQVARQLVIYKKRPGGQSQFRESLEIPDFDVDGFREPSYLGLEKSRRRTAACRSARRTRRHEFAKLRSKLQGKAFRTPAKAVEVFRLEAARRACWKKPSTASTASPAASV